MKIGVKQLHTRLCGQIKICSGKFVICIIKLIIQLCGVDPMSDFIIKFKVVAKCDGTRLCHQKTKKMKVTQLIVDPDKR
jgi:hypothetical protein